MTHGIEWHCETTAKEDNKVGSHLEPIVDREWEIFSRRRASITTTSQSAGSKSSSRDKARKNHFYVSLVEVNQAI